jgi:WD40 repeat protein
LTTVRLVVEAAVAVTAVCCNPTLHAQSWDTRAIRAKAGPERVDRFGDPLPPGAVARLGSVRFRVGGEMTALRYTADGKTLLVCSYLGEAQIHNSADSSRRELFLLDAKSGAPRARRTINLHRTPGRWGAYQSFVGPPQWCLSPNGQYFASVEEETSWQSSIKVTDLFSGEVVFQVKDSPSRFAYLNFFPDGKCLGALDCDLKKKSKAGPNEPVVLHIWNIDTRQEVRYLALADAGKAGQAFRPEWFLVSPDGKCLAAVETTSEHERKVRLWDLRSGKGPWRLEGDGPLNGELAFSPDGKNLAGALGDKLCLWEAATGRLGSEIGHMDGGPLAILFSPDGKKILVRAEKALHYWDLSAGWEIMLPHSDAIDFQFSPDGRTLALVTEKDIISLVDTVTGKERHRLAGGLGREDMGEALLSITDRHVRARQCQGLPVAFSPDGAILAAVTLCGVVQRWSTATGKELPLPGINISRPTDLAYTPDGKELAANVAGVALWETSSGKALRRLPRPAGLGTATLGVILHAEAGPFCLAISPDGQQIVAGWEDGSVCAWDRATGKVRWSARQHQSLVVAIAYTADGSALVSSAHMEGLVWWDPTTGRPARTLLAPGNEDEGPMAPNCFHLSSRARTVVLFEVRDTRKALVYELATGRVRAQLPTGAHGMEQSPDGKFLAVADGEKIILFELTAGAARRYLRINSNARSLAFSPDASLVAAGCHDGSLRVWHTATGTLLLDTEAHPGGVCALAFAPQGRILASAGTDTTTLLWHLSKLCLPAERPQSSFANNAGGKAPAIIPGSTRTDDLGEPLPAAARARLGAPRFQEGAPLSSVRFLPNGKDLLTVPSGSGLGWGYQSISLWDAASGRRRAVLNQVLGRVMHATLKEDGKWKLEVTPPTWSLSADGRLLALKENPEQGGTTISIRDVATGRALSRISQEEEWWTCPQFAPDGKSLAVACSSGEKLVRLLDPITGHERQCLPRVEQDERFVPNLLVFAPDGKRLAVLGIANATAARLYDLAGAGPPTALPGCSWVIAPPVFTPDGKLLAGAAHVNEQAVNHLCIWDSATGKVFRDLGEHEEHSKTLAFSPDGRLLASLLQDRVRLWDVGRGKELASIKQSNLNSLAFSPDGHAIAVGDGAAICLYDTATWVRLWKIRLALTERYDERNGVEYFFDSRQGLGLPFAFSPDGKRLAVVVGQGLCIIDVATGKNVFRDDPWGPAHVVAVAAGGQRIAAGHADEVVLWNPNSAKVSQRLKMGPVQGTAGPALASLALSPDGKLLATGLQDGTIWLASVETGKTLSPCRGHTGQVQGLAFALDGRTFASVGKDRRVCLWDAAGGRLLRRVDIPADERSRRQNSSGLIAQTDGAKFNAAPAETALAAYGSRLAILEDRFIRLLDTGGKKQQSKIEPNFWVSSPLAFSRDGEYVVAGCYDGICLFSTGERKECRFFGPCGSGVTDMVFSPDGHFLAAAMSEGVQLWEVGSATPIAALDGHRGPVVAVAFSPDGQTLVTSGSDTTLLVWDMPTVLHKAPDPAPSALELAALWEQLASADATKAYEALCRLQRHPGEAVNLVKTHLKAVPTPDGKRIAGLVTDLAHARYAARHKASQELARLGELAEPALRQALHGDPPLELCRRIELLLSKLDGPVTRPEQLQALRATELLERLGTAPARDLLIRLADGWRDARLTREARAALERLSKRW